MPIAEDLFAEKESLQEIRQTINDEILSQMKSETADAEKLEAVFTGSFEQLRAKLPKFANSFAKFHATLTPEQRAEIVEKIEKHRKRAEKVRTEFSKKGYPSAWIIRTKIEPIND